MSDIETHYRRYFQLFRDMAPHHMVIWGGYMSGEPTGMASSLESILEFAKLVKDQDAMILNAGAGASSFVLRKIFKNVICTDPDPIYLQVVKDICAVEGLSTENFIANSLPECDYCYYDYGNKERIPMLAEAIVNTRIALYIDDTDTRPECKEYRDYVQSLKLNIRDCKEAEDEYGRWGIILQK